MLQHFASRFSPSPDWQFVFAFSRILQSGHRFLLSLLSPRLRHPRCTRASSCNPWYKATAWHAPLSTDDSSLEVRPHARLTGNGVGDEMSHLPPARLEGFEGFMNMAVAKFYGRHVEDFNRAATWWRAPWRDSAPHETYFVKMHRSRACQSL